MNRWEVAHVVWGVMVLSVFVLAIRLLRDAGF